MKVVDIAVAKVHLSALVDDALEGEEVVVARRGEPLVRLVPVVATRVTRLGGLRGRGRIAPDFDAPLDELAPRLRRRGRARGHDHYLTVEVLGTDVVLRGLDGRDGVVSISCGGSCVEL